MSLKIHLVRIQFWAPPLRGGDVDALLIDAEVDFVL